MTPQSFTLDNDDDDKRKLSTDKEIYLPITRDVGKARRLKQAKDEATEEIEKYRNEREKQFKDFENKVRETKKNVA
jgi:hypothetical protein